MKKPNHSMQNLSAAAALAATFVACAAAHAAPAKSTPAKSTPAAVASPAAFDKTKYQIGGPLEGLKLPPNPRGLADEVELYPGSVEHWRAYFMKYLPTRSFFDAQSQIKNFQAAEIAGVPKERVEQWAEPVYELNKYGTGKITDKSLPPVAVVRAGIRNPIFKLDLGELPISMYCIRVIAAAETKTLRAFREPEYVTLKINDGNNGEVSTYRQRISYTDAFYSVAEIYFHAPVQRAYSAELFVDEGSKVDLLIHNISLDDVLAGSTRRAVKTRQTLYSPAQIEEIKKMTGDVVTAARELKIASPQERLERDALIWNTMPPINAQGGWTNFDRPLAGYESGTNDKTKDQIAEQWGEWEGGNLVGYGLFPQTMKDLHSFIVNKKLNLSYTIDDLYAHKPLPDPYPLKDDGSGLFFPDPNDPAKGRAVDAIANGVSWRFRTAPNYGGPKYWLASGNEEIARDSAIGFVRYAYQYPSIDSANYFQVLSIIPGQYGRDTRFRQREEYNRWQSSYFDYAADLQTYDLLFPYLKGNEELAQSVHRFIPWVNNSQDVIKLIDVYLVQHLTKKILRYHYHIVGNALPQAATELGDTKVTDPWMEWLFTKTFQYPLAPAGYQDLMISANEREGPQFIGSAFYAGGENALGYTQATDEYMRSGGNPKYDLGDPKRFPKTLASAYWSLNVNVAGRDFLRIGDVTGPDKPSGRMLPSENYRQGWKWSKDPNFAWLIKNVLGRKDEGDAQWKEITTAASSIKRAPYLDLHSREVNNWAAILESGLQHDDYRFRRAAYVRAGIGTGHNHADTLDLQVVAHGLPMTMDDGQRTGYTKPNSRFSRIHNTVEVNGVGNQEFGLSSYAWTQNIADAPGAEYSRVNAIPPPNAKYFNRQTALIDVDDVAPQKLSIEQQKPGAKLPPVTSTPNSYVFDVFRVSGGSTHLYNFHAMVDDEFTWNAKNEKPIGAPTATYQVDSDANILGEFSLAPESKFGGDSPSTLEATWRYSRDEKKGNYEQRQLGENYDPNSPRKYTRLHLLNTDGMRALRAEIVSSERGYHITNTSAVKRGENLESAFTAIIEPYEGEPFLTSQKLLPIEGNETDALRAVAVEVKTKNGHTDVNFADGRPDKTRTVGTMSFAGEFGFVSNDANGLRQATLSGGTLLSTPDVKITAAAREYSSQVKSVNYLEKQMTLDKPFPIASVGRVFEIGTPDKWTSYTSAAIEGSTLSVTKGADYFRSPIGQVVPEENRVDTKLGHPLGFGGNLPGTGWIVSNDDVSKVWRSKKIGGNDFYLDAPVKEADFPNKELRVWEYGMGDKARISTFISLRRMENNLFELRGDADVQIALKSKTIEFSSNQKSWRKLEGKAANGLTEVSVALSKLGAQPVFLRVK